VEATWIEKKMEESMIEFELRLLAFLPYQTKDRWIPKFAKSDSQ
jgi:hypothetical protein